MSGDFTQLFREHLNGSDRVQDELWPLLYQELHRLADFMMNDQANGHTLQATALVNEAFLKLVSVKFRGSSRTEFIALAAKAMRSILVDHARAKSRNKRGNNVIHVTLSGVDESTNDLQDILYLHEAMEALAKVDERMARLLELRVFGGLTHDEIAIFRRLIFLDSAGRYPLRQGLDEIAFGIETRLRRHPILRTYQINPPITDPFLRLCLLLRSH